MWKLRALGVVLCLTILGGCNSPDQDHNGGPDRTSSRSLLDNALKQLREEKPSVASYRGAVQQLNVYLDNPEKPVEFKVDPALRNLLASELLLKVPEGPRRLRDLEAKTFNIVDASHLDACFLFHDAADVLLRDLGDLPSKNDEAAWRSFNQRLASYAFAWTMRQVQLTPRAPGSDVWPAHDILRRGTGDAEERLRVFLALVEQLNLFRAEERRLEQIALELERERDAERQKSLHAEQTELENMVTRHKLEAGLLVRGTEVQEDDGTKRMQETPWLAVIIVGDEILLFDPAAGQQVLTSSGQPLTWTQAKQNPATLPGGNAEVLQRASLQIMVSLPALAPRMNWLQEQLEQAGILLHQKPLARLSRFERAKTGLPVRVWQKPGSPGLPLAVLPLYVENPNQDKRLRDLIVPRYLLPDWVQELGRQLASSRDQQRLFGDFDELFIRLRLEPGGVRDLLVRGRAEEAVQRILLQEDRIDKAMDIYRRDVNPVPDLRKNWVPQMVARSQSIKDLSLRWAAASEAERPAIQQQMNQEVVRINALWKDRAFQFSNMAVIWAAPEYRAHLSYFMALAKMDLAQRTELREQQQAGQATPKEQMTSLKQWQSALEWLDRYDAVVLTVGKNPWQSAITAQRHVCEQRIKALTAAK